MNLLMKTGTPHLRSKIFIWLLISPILITLFTAAISPFMQIMSIKELLPSLISVPIIALLAGWPLFLPRKWPWIIIAAYTIVVLAAFILSYQMSTGAIGTGLNGFAFATFLAPIFIFAITVLPHAILATLWHQQKRVTYQWIVLYLLYFIVMYSFFGISQQTVSYS